MEGMFIIKIVTFSLVANNLFKLSGIPSSS